MKYPLDPKDVETRRITATTTICEGPCLLVSLLVSPITTGGYATAHNGVNASAPAVVDVIAPNTASNGYDPPVPVYLSQGLHVVFTTLAGSVTVQFVKLQQTE
jgi:hypothetical protein